MAGTTTVAGGAAHGMAVLSHEERLAAQNVLSKLKESGSALGSHLGGTLESATVSGGHRLSTGGLGASTLLSARGSDTFMGGVRSAPLSSGLHAGNDTVVSGSTRLAASEALGARGAQHFSLSADTINVAGVTAAHIQTGQPRHDITGTHTITLSDKTTIKIAGLSAHDITKLHH
jgi:hypothetical protein